MDLLSLPVVMIENILSYLSYDEIARNRVVCKLFNELSMRMLNRGFLMIERRHAQTLKSVKTQLPRRESERRYHPLARHCDILTSIETRISMLNMTYSKFIDMGICCFIPGKVIDEIRRVLLIAETQKAPPRAHEVLQELRDISSMAIEHFDDKISPALRQRLRAGDEPPPPRTQHAVFVPLAMRQEVLSLRRRSILNAKLSLYLAKQYKKYHKRMMEYRKIAIRQRTLVRDLTRKQKAQDAAIAELKKRIEECDVRYSELTHTNQAVGGKAKAAVGSESPPPAQPLRHFGSQIKLDLSVLPIGTSKRTHNAILPNMKPRKPVIKLPSLSADEPAKLAKSEPRPSPSSSRGPIARAQSSLAKIRGITSEIRHLTHLSKNIENKLKRTATCVDTDDSAADAKKQKLD